MTFALSKHGLKAKDLQSQSTTAKVFVCLLFVYLEHTINYSNKVRPAGATRIIINATLDIRRFKRYSEMTIYKRPLKNENTPRLV